MDVIQISRYNENTPSITAAKRQQRQQGEEKHESSQQQQQEEGHQEDPQQLQLQQQEESVCLGSGRNAALPDGSDVCYVVNIASCGAAALAAEMAGRYKRWARLGEQVTTGEQSRKRSRCELDASAA